MPQVFDPRNHEWRDARAELDHLLTPDELSSARASTLNAHYTSATVIRAMYSALEKFGFEHGRILEPACGIGHFIGLMPERMHRESVVTGVEIDSLTARIAGALYPDADIRAQGLETAKLAEESYDVAVSNIPFGDYPVHDPRFNSYRFPIHDYFFAKTLDKVRPGGLVLFVTSRGTMDKVNSTLRDYLGSRTQLLGAIRLPNTAFKQNAGTEVTTDIVMLRKLNPGETPSGPKWRQVRDFKNHNGEIIPINEYFVERPHMMLGHFQLTGRMYRNNEPTLEGDGRVLGDALAVAIENLPVASYHPNQVHRIGTDIERAIPTSEDIKPNAFCIHQDGRVCINEEGIFRPLDGLPVETRSRIRRLIGVRDAVRACLRSQLDGSTEEQVADARFQLNLVYDRFVARHGPINAPANQRAFHGDPDLPLLLSLENYSAETKVASKAAIFRERTIHHKQPVESVGTPKEALLVALNEKGRVDLDHISLLLNRPVDEIIPELKGVIFLNPQTKHWETEDEYLSGNVREKLSVAETATNGEPRFRENVEALKSVLPEDLPATEIDVRLGASWLPPGDVAQFTHDLLGVASGVQVGHIHALGSWHISANWEARGATANTTDWGTNRYTALELIEETLNLKTPTVYDYADKKAVLNAQETEAARDKQERIKERFRDWVWTDDSRRERLVRLYNDTFNRSRVRTFNGEHLTLPGASAAVQLHIHQKAGVWRILQTPNTLLAHVVGAGKTFTMVAAAMELKRLGLARKPMFTVPNHMLGQFSTELLTLYPGANILVAGKEDFEAQNRKKLFARIATGNWDAVIVTHSGFERIPLSRETRVRYFQEQIDELEKIKLEFADSENRRLVKELEKARKRLEAKLQSLSADHKKDNTLTFEELGVDRLFVDEAHYFKNLFYVSKMTRIAGLPQTASERAFDMFLKVRHVQSVNNGGGVVFATGTPIANSMAEMFTMQRYLQPGELQKHNLDHFDSWAATFGEPVTAMELSPDGAGYRLNTRFARFVNVPELMQIFRQTADVQTAQMLSLPRPKLDTGKPIIRNAPAAPELKEFVEGLAKRAEALRSRRVDPRDDNMLKITSEGRKAALDLRLVKAHLSDDPQSKVNLAVETIHRIWDTTKADRLAQAVFCDLSTPKDRGFSVYRDMAEKLNRLGIPQNEIAFIQDYDSDGSKLALFRSVREGKVRVLFGSTQKMGSGTNVQERLVALHHLDAPWRPADVEQREGRILRQGNRNATVRVYRYVTEGSFDAYMWQTLETKAKFISQVMSGDMTVRRLEDMDAAALTYAEVKAIASGNPLVIEKAQVDAELMRLTRLRSAHAEEQYRIRSGLRHAREQAETWTARLSNLREDMKYSQDTSGDKFRIELDGQVIDNRGVAGELLVRRAEKLRDLHEDVRAGTFAGFDLFIRCAFNNSVDLVLRGRNSYNARVTDTALGTIRSLESVVQGFEERTARLELDIQDSRKRASELEAKVGAKFEKEDRYHFLVKRQSEIGDQLDLTKNQAPSQAEGLDENEEGNSINQSVNKLQTRRAPVRV